jgi:hypothetical protein
VEDKSKAPEPPDSRLCNLHRTSTYCTWYYGKNPQFFFPSYFYNCPKIAQSKTISGPARSNSFADKQFGEFGRNVFSGANLNSFAILGKKKLQNFQYHKSKINK